MSCLKSANLPDSTSELVLADALHCIRSLLFTSTNATPHERFFNLQRRIVIWGVILSKVKLDYSTYFLLHTVLRYMTLQKPVF